MYRSISRRHALSLLSTVSIAGCSQLNPFSNNKWFRDGPEEWSPEAPAIPDNEWPMVDRHPDGRASTPASGPTDFPLEKAWTTNLSSKAVRPIVRNETAYLSLLTNDGIIVAVDVSDGTEKWRVTHDEVSGAVPAISGEFLFAPYQHPEQSSKQGVTAYESDSGSKQWHHAANHVDGNVVITDSSVLTTGSKARIFALDQTSGQLAWKYKPGNPNDRVTELAITDKVYFSTSGSETDTQDVGFVHALDPSAGELSWSVKFEMPVRSLAVTDEMVLAGSHNIFAALTTDTGSEQWTHEIGPSGPEQIAIKDDLAIVSTKKNIVAYEISSGDRRWEAPAPEYAQVAIADNVVYATSSISREGPGITAHEVQSGKQLWSVPGGEMSPPTIADNRLFVGTGRGEILAWE